MKLSISNLAWDPSEDAEICQLLMEKEIYAIDVVPSRYFPDVSLATRREVLGVYDWWDARGISIQGLQSLLFGTQGLNLFAGEPIRDKMLTHFERIFSIANDLRAPKVVFGSPRNRDRTGLTDSDAYRIAIEFFGKVGELAESAGVVFCLEPSPSRYGSNFMTTFEETRAVVAAVESQSIRVQIDTGAMMINKEDPNNLLATILPFVGHIHLSEPDLAPLGDSLEDHLPFALAFSRNFRDWYATIEMLATSKESHIASVRRAVDFVLSRYQNGVGS